METYIDKPAQNEVGKKIDLCMLMPFIVIALALMVFLFATYQFV